MTKKYKHKSTGIIAELNHSGNTYKIPKKIEAIDIYNIPKWIVENSCDWEEVIEKDYEILSFLTTSNHSVRINSKIIKLENGNFEWEVTPTSKTGVSEKELLISCDKGYNKIFSIKRLSDGCVFTIGDNVEIMNSSCNKFTITKFYLDCNNNHLLCNDDNGRGHVNITKIQKVKQPLFTTEDGVEIFEGDAYHIVYKPTFNISSYKEATFTKLENKDYLYFSTIKAAQNWIIQNKPCLSLNEVFDTMSWAFQSEFKRLEEIVKSKL